MLTGDIRNKFDKLWNENPKKGKDRKRTEQSFLVPVDKIRANKYDLSINKYKEIVYEEVQYDSTNKILQGIEKLEEEIPVSQFFQKPGSI